MVREFGKDVDVRLGGGSGSGGDAIGRTVAVVGGHVDIGQLNTRIKKMEKL